MFSIYMLLAILLNVISYNFIPQALALFNVSSDVFYWFQMGNVHAIRLLIAYPAVLIQEYCNVSLNIAFTYYVGMIFCLIYIWGEKIFSLYGEEAGFTNIWFVVLVALSMVMNGRVVFAFCGFMMIIYSILRLEHAEKANVLKIILGIFLPFVLTMVSTGTMIVTAAYIIMMFFWLFSSLLEKKPRRKLIHICCGILLLALPLVVYTIMYIYKMIVRAFASRGDIISFLQHGAGNLMGITSIYGVMILAIVGVVFMSINTIYIHKIIKYHKYYLPIILAVNVGLYGIIFGYSAGSMMILPLTILIVIGLNHKRRFSRIHRVLNI